MSHRPIVLGGSSVVELKLRRKNADVFVTWTARSPPLEEGDVVRRPARGIRTSSSCARPTGTTSRCCAPSSCGAAVAERGAGMIESLSIRDFALVDRLAMEFDPASPRHGGDRRGQVHPAQALGLLLGRPGQPRPHPHRAEAARVEGTFLVEDGARDAVRALLDEAGVEWKSRCASRAP